MTTSEVLGRKEQHLATADLVRESNPLTPPEAKHAEGHEPLFAHDQTEDFRSRWQAVQGSFVDDPRSAVKQADELVASTIKRLAEVFAGERAKLEHEWSKGDEVSTEDLRQALRRYRSFFDQAVERLSWRDFEYRGRCEPA